MGGGSYDRDVYSSSSSWGSGSYGSYSSHANKAMSAHSLDDSMFPKNRILHSSSKHPIIVVLDVTGSNIAFAKIVYDKMPMFFGQIEQKGYLKDFDMAICACGDAHGDNYPIQIPEFAKGTEIDNWLKKLVLEGNGGGQRMETYELVAYYLLHNLSLENGAEPVILFLGDEAPYNTVTSDIIKEYINSDYTETVDTKEVFTELLKKYPNTFLFLNPYNGVSLDSDIRNKWVEMFGDKADHIITMERHQEKAIVDLMLSVIAMVGETDLKNYKVDMLDRGQTSDRIDSIDRMLGNISKSLVPVTKVENIAISNSHRNRSNGSNRL